MNRLFEARRAAERAPDPGEPKPAAQFKARAPRDPNAGLTDGQVMLRDWCGVKP